jgi:hypothetical protein
VGCMLFFAGAAVVALILVDLWDRPKDREQRV